MSPDLRGLLGRLGAVKGTSMLQKLLWSTAGVTALGLFVFGEDAWSYLTTSVSTVRQAVKQEVPLEFEVQRARELVTQVDGEIRRCLRVIAEDEVNVDDLRKQIATQTEEHARQKEHVLQLRSDLKENRETYTYRGRAYTRGEVQQDLADRFHRYQLVEDTIKSRREVLVSREKALGAARKKLEAMLDGKEQLQVQIENLDARLKTLQAAQSASDVAFDESQVSRTRQLIQELNKQVEVRQKLLQGNGDTTGLIPLDAPELPNSEITQQIDTYFQTESDSAAQPATPATAPTATPAVATPTTVEVGTGPETAS